MDNHQDGTPANITNTDLPIQDEMKSCYLDYAMSVIVGRALPDVRDGLKPVHRRVLYSMHQLNNYHNRPYMKSARVVGEVIGKFHPHGDAPVYGAIVRLAQDFSMRYPIIQGQGNFGSMDGDNAAAMRYTEVRMEKIGSDILQDIDKETVDFVPNYDGSLKEPVLLPTKVPYLLINGSTGIAVGMATNIPPHNLGEVLRGLLAYIDNPDISFNELFQIITGPDFPTGGIIHGRKGIISAYQNGKGIIQIRGKSEIEENPKNGKFKIIINEIPYQVNKAKLIEKVASLVNEKEIKGISDIRDESNRLGVRVVIELKRGENPQVVLNQLYKHTQLQVSFGIIFLGILNGRPRVLNLVELLDAFLKHRQVIVIRRTQYELRKAEEKAHILEGLKLAVENMDEVINLIKTSSGPSEAKTKLKTQYPLSDTQAQAILDMRLQRLTGLEVDKIKKDYEETLEVIKKLREILASTELVNQIIIDETNEILEKFSDERRTEIICEENEFQVEDLITAEEVIVTITNKGYIKRMGLDTYKSQRRGGKGVKGAELSDDFYTDLFTANTHSTILFFTNKGTVFSLKVYQIPEGSRTAKGRNVINLLSLAQDERVAQILALPSDREDLALIMATKKGMVKKTLLSEYKNIKQSGIKGMKVIEGDALLNVNLVTDGKDILVCSKNGKVIRFEEKDCRAMGRVSQGVRGIALEGNDEVIGMEVIDDTSEILTVTDKGFGKRTKAEEYRCQSRGGKGILAMKLTDKTGQVVQIRPVYDKGDLMIITDKGQVIRISLSSVSMQGRATQGVRLINLNSSEKVVAIENIVEEETETETETETDTDT